MYQSLSLQSQLSQTIRERDSLLASMDASTKHLDDLSAQLKTALSAKQEADKQAALQRESDAHELQGARRLVDLHKKSVAEERARVAAAAQSIKKLEVYILTLESSSPLQLLHLLYLSITRAGISASRSSRGRRPTPQGR